LSDDDRSDRFKQVLAILNRNAEANTVAQCRTDIDGKYQLTDVPTGMFYAVSSFGHLSGDKHEYLLWLTPVSVTAGQVTHLDIDSRDALETML